MAELIPVIDKTTIARRIGEIARQISSDYKDADLVLVGVLKGAFVFMADLIRQLSLKNVTVDFVRLASYGSASESTGRINLLHDVETDIKGRDVLIVEDILDTGHSLTFLKRHIASFQPRSLKTCVLIDKNERRRVEVRAEYVCHTIKKGFLVGYGLDHAEAYRHLPEIFTLNF